MMETGKTYTVTTTVTEKDTALAVGSGTLQVLATPRMIALMEEAAMNCVAEQLADTDTTVGTLMNTTHVKASAIGAEIKVTAELTAVDGRKLSFTVKAHQGDTLIGEGTHERFVVNIERFMSKLR
ncbi:MAG: thioesterase family protein [Bacteroidales bacterium]|nr:thioesterase family protein [Bacteroidales bacterium]